MPAAFDVARATWLGALQGVTEFLPISSDGHLALARSALGFDGGGLAETVLLHVGTLLATLLVLRSEVRTTLREAAAALHDEAARDKAPAREAAMVLLASIPTAIIGLLLKDVVEAWSTNVRVVGVFLLVSAVFVAGSHRFRSGTLEVLNPKRALLVGLLQGLAVLPGWSRSATTIASGMALGLSPSASFRFSFLLSLPAVAGACLLELRDPDVWTTLGPSAWFGAVIAFFTGAAALRLLRGVVSSGRFAFFAVYLIPLGLALATGMLTASAD